jgi:CubicO group peptidase (beta-lactamase class C family)
MRFMAAAFTVLCAAASLLGADTRPKPLFPAEDWPESSPESQGVDSTKLKAAVAYMQHDFGPDGARELLIIRNGYMIHQGPDVDAYHNVWSCTKTFTSTVLGLLIADGKCALEDLAVKHLPSLDDAYPLYAQIRLRHLASMSSGFQGQVVNVTKEQPWGDPMYFLNATEPLFEAGTQVQYHDHQVLLLGRILTRIAGEPLQAVFKRRIADPIGMKRWGWGVVGSVDGIALNNAPGNPAKPGIQTTARQMARLGYLYLNRGNWNGKELLPSSFVEEVTRNQAPAAGKSAFLHSRYGFYWWTNDVMPDGKRPWPAAPPGTYTSHGHSSNFCFVVPKWNMVVVRMGTIPLSSGAGGLRYEDARRNTFFAKLGEALGRD